MATEQCWGERERERERERDRHTQQGLLAAGRYPRDLPQPLPPTEHARSHLLLLLAQELFDTALGPPDYARTTPRTLLEAFLPQEQS